MMSKIFLVAVLVLLITGCNEDKTSMLSPLMQKPKKETYVICSPMQGTLLENGQPLAKVKITRELKWSDSQESLIEHFYTDENGLFSLPLHEESLKLNALAEFIAVQRISVKHKDSLVDIWGSSQSGTLYGENGGVEIKAMICDLSSPFVPVYGESISLLSTKCRWDNINLEYKENE